MKKSIVISLVAVTILFCTAIYTFASTGIVTTDTLRLRKDASTEASIVALLSMDDKIEILEEKDGWYKVKSKVNGKTVEGYVAAKYVKVEETKAPVKNEVVPEENTVKEEETNTEENKNENTEQNEENKTMVKTLPVDTQIYITPLINSLVLDKLSEEKRIEVASEVNGWTYITTGDIKGWVKTEKIIEKEVSEPEQNTSSQKTGYISGNSVSLREQAESSSNVILKLLKNTKVNVLSEEDGWAKVEYNGNIGYVSTKYVSDKKVAVTSRSSEARTSTTKATSTETKSEASTTKTETKTESSGKSSAKGSDIVAYAKKYLGSKYVYGGSSPSGFDCSGFTSYIYKHFGYSLTRTSSGQSSQGKAVSKEELQPGDLVCFSRSSGSKKIGHVGIYTGGGKFIHAANARKGVIISNLTGSGFYFVKARRII